MRKPRTKVEQLSEIRSQRYRDNHLGDTKVHKVDDEHGDGCNGRDEDLVTPSDIEQVVADTQQDDGLQREDGRQVRRKLENGSMGQGDAWSGAGSGTLL